MGGSSIIALYPMTVEQARSAVIEGSMTRAIAIGQALRHARGRGLDPLAEILQLTSGYLLFRGKVIDVMRRTTGGFARGTATFEGMGDDTGTRLQLEFQNEHLVALRDGRPIATVPDLITVLDAEAHLPITTEGIAYGQRVEVLGIPCAPLWRTPKALELVGPGYFGYPFAYVPVEEVTPHALPSGH